MKLVYLFFGSSNEAFYEPKIDGEHKILKDNWNNEEKYGNRISGPTIAEVVDWISEKYKIWVHIDNCNIPEKGMWCYDIHKLPTGVLKMWKRGDDVYSTPYEAYSNAIEYVLTNLI